ncbi:ImmA/IrrE family metallo-endopeptidase [Acidicapsa dinghuensis]|uniref:ImmA/IrrE family metallo-endopeptidase n=1 Tax=Acidicapsa dinghuensis TaxID=2218256 RepID=A0ABW1EGX1_9BACT|nr:ImmA/IrrE family metallo-endopeptidase [Acidicapsa dinghuensis]
MRAIISARGLSSAYVQDSLAIREDELKGLLAGKLHISSELAKRLAAVMGSTPRFWLERDKQYHASLKAIELATPELTRWSRSFPLNQMVKAGWLVRPSSGEVAEELLEFFGVSNLTEWRENYQARLGHTKFRTSASFENSVGSTTAWIRHGEIIAEEMNCGAFDKVGFRKSLQEIKNLTPEKSPRHFIPVLQQECAKHGVAVVVARCVSGCAASGATHLLESGTALLLLSARFLSDDQFWFSFFHEAGHLVLHTNEACVEEKEAESSAIEEEANAFAQDVILDPLGRGELMALHPNKFSIARFARRCRVSAGLIVGQLQHNKKINHGSYNLMKVRYLAEELNL